MHDICVRIQVLDTFKENVGGIILSRFYSTTCHGSFHGSHRINEVTLSGMGEGALSLALKARQAVLLAVDGEPK